MKIHRKTVYAAVGAGSEALEKTKKAVSVALKGPDVALGVANRVRARAGDAAKDAAKRFDHFAARGEKVLAGRIGPANGATNGAGKPRKSPKPKVARVATPKSDSDVIPAPEPAGEAGATTGV